jgi:mRNA guanylyltransferase
LPKPSGGYHVNTLLDGELVFENEKHLHLLFFDALVIDGKNICQKPYTTRLGYLRRDIVIPYQERCRKDKQYARRYPFQMTQKRLELAYNLPVVFQVMESYRHKTDGVIFTSAGAPYELGTCEKMLKWKPADENTVDFIVTSQPDGFHISVLKSDRENVDLGLFTIDEDMAQEWDF